MQKVFILLFFILNSFLFAGINAVVSILPEKTFVKAIGGDKVNVALMVQPGAEPENYEPKPSQMKDIVKAQVYFAIGVQFEKIWLPKFSNQNSKMLIIDLSKGIQKISMPTFRDTNKKADDGAMDPHVWTSPENIKVIALNILNALSALDSKNTAYYNKNYQQFIGNIDKVDAKIREILKGTPRNAKFMVFHPAWGYFAKQYQLVQFPIQVEGKSPKPRELAYIIKKARDEHIKAIFTQPEFSDKVATVISNELGIKVIKASPLSADWAQNLIDFASSIARDK